MLEFLFSIDWAELFIPTVTPLAGIVRISVVYLFLFFLIRFTLKREAAAFGISDLLVVVLVADAVQNAMAGEYRSITDGLILAATLIFWNWFLSYASIRWPQVRPIVRPAPLLLVRHGQPIWPNLRSEHIDEDELLSQLRLQGVERLEDVKFAFMEMDGRVSVIQENGGQHQGNQEKKGLG